MNVHALQNWLETSGFSLLVGVALASSVLCLAAWLASRLLNRLGAATRFGVWQLALAGVLLTSLLLVCMDGIPVGPLTPVSSKDLGVAEPLSPGRKVKQPADTSRARREPQPRFAKPGGNVSAPAAIAAELAPLRSKVALPGILAGTWFVLTASLLARVIGSAVRAHRIVRRAERVQSAVAARAFEAARQRLGLPATCHVQLKCTTELPIPFTLGLLQPAIVIPAEAEGWSEAALEMVFAHELAHVVRRDACGHLLNRLTCCVAGFNPLVWLAARRCAYECEVACDDRALAAGYVAADYSACLLEVAAGMRGRRGLPAPALSMAYPEFRRRLETVLAANVDRRPLSKTLVWPLVATFAALALMAGVLRPFETRLVADEQPGQVAGGQKANNEKVTIVADDASPDGKIVLGSGKITDRTGQPLGGAKLEVDLLDLSGEQSSSDPLVRRWNVTTDAEGAFECRADEEIAIGPKTELRIRASLPGYVSSDGRWGFSQTEQKTGRWTVTAKLWETRKLVGRVIDFDGRPTAATIEATGQDADPNDRWWAHDVQVPAGGRFELMVPEHMDIQQLVFVGDRSPTSVEVSTRSDLGDIRVERGTLLTGRLLDRNDQPVEGVVIGMTSINEMLPDPFNVQWATLTDADGRFRLRPMQGKVAIWAAKTATTMEGKVKQLTGNDPPPVVPVILEVTTAPGVAEIAVELREAETVTISGMARFYDGQPAADMEVRGGDGRCGATLARAKTNAEGRYELKMPKPLTSAYLFAVGANDSRGEWKMAQKVGGLDGYQFIEFTDLKEDQQNVDWVLKTYKRN